MKDRPIPALSLAGVGPGSNPNTRTPWRFRFPLPTGSKERSPPDGSGGRVLFIAEITGYQFLISAVPTLKRLSGMASSAASSPDFMASRILRSSSSSITIMRQSAGRHHSNAPHPIEALDRAVERAAQIQASAVLRHVMRKVNIQNDRNAGRRRVTQNRMIEKTVSVWNAPARRRLGRRVRLREIEVLASQRIQNMIGQRRSPGITWRPPAVNFQARRC